MNKYHEILYKILEKGNLQENKKGNIKYLHNQHLHLKPLDLLEILEGHSIARNKLKKELDLFLNGEHLVETYKQNGIDWWDYCGTNLINGYPTYFEKLPKLIDKINQEKRSSKNYTFYLGSNDVKTSQQPCLSFVQFQIDNKELVVSAVLRSSDASLGLPADIYHLYHVSRKIDVPLRSIDLFLCNVHVYENNIELTKELLEGKSVKFNLNV